MVGRAAAAGQQVLVGPAPSRPASHAAMESVASLSRRKVPELKALCADKGLAKSGTKGMLIERLLGGGGSSPHDEVAELVGKQRDGWSLDRPFYTDQARDLCGCGYSPDPAPRVASP